MAVKDQARRALPSRIARRCLRAFVAAANSIGEATQEIAGQLDQIDDRVLSGSLRDESAALLQLRRGISRQERLVQAAHSVLRQLEHNRAESVLQAYRDLGLQGAAAGRCFHADLHLQAERARLLQEELAAQLATATNRNLFALTAVTTVLLPPAFVTGYFGMNTKGLPFGDLDYGTGLRDHSLPARGGRLLSANPSLPGGLLKRLYRCLRSARRLGSARRFIPPETRLPLPLRRSRARPRLRAKAPWSCRKAACPKRSGRWEVRHLSHFGALRVAPTMLANDVRRKGPIHA